MDTSYRIRRLLTAAFVVSLLGSSLASAQQVPQRISYQGMLTGADDAPLDGTVDLAFAFYARETGGQPLANWSERYDDEPVRNGRFDVLLGSQEGGLPSTLFDNRTELWLEVEVDGEAMPRVRMTSAPFALQAQRVVEGAIGTSALDDQAVTGAKLSEDAAVLSINGMTGDVQVEGENGASVRADGNTLLIRAPGGGDGDSGVQVIQSSDNALTIDGPDDGGTVTIDVAEGGITSSMLEDEAVTSAKIDDGAVGSDALSNGAVVRSLEGQTDAVELTSDDGSVSIEAGGGVIDLSAQGGGGGGLTSVSTDGTLTGDGTSNDALGIADGGVGTEQLADEAVTSAKIDDGAVGADALSNGAVVRSLEGQTDAVELTSDDGSVSIEAGSGVIDLSAQGGGDGDGVTAVTAGEGLSGGGTSGEVTLDLADGGVTAEKLESGTPSQDGQVLSFEGGSLTWIEVDDGDGGGGQSVHSDETLTGQGTPGNPLGLANGGVTAIKLEPNLPNDDDAYVLAYEDGTMEWREADDIDDDAPFLEGEQRSSLRFKEDVETLEAPLALVEQLRGVRYRWTESGEPDVGVIAEEVAEVLPELVEFDEEGRAEGVHYARLTAVLIEAVKAQQQEIAAKDRAIAQQQEEIDALNDRVDRLEELLERAVDESAHTESAADNRR